MDSFIGMLRSKMKGQLLEYNLKLTNILYRNLQKVLLSAHIYDDIVKK